MKYKERVEASKEYGLFKFKVPSIEERNAAIDMSGEGTLYKKIILTDLNSFYNPIQVPKNNDKISNNWLLSHKEYGQTYTEFIRTKSYFPLKDKKDIIYLVYLNFTKSVQKEKKEEKNLLTTGFIEDINLNEYSKSKTKKIYYEDDLDLTVNIPENLNENLLDLTLNMVKNYFFPINVELINFNVPLGNLIFRKEDESDNLVSIEADSLLNYLKQFHKIDNFYCILYFTNIDLFHNVSIYKENKVNKYQFYPKSFLNNDSCFEINNAKIRKALISLSEFKVKINNYNNKKDKNIIEDKDEEETKQKKLESKSFKNYIKLILRNICLLFGLSNCIFYECLLNGFNSLDYFNSLPLELCPVCLKKLYGVILRKDQDIEEKIKNSMQIYERFKLLSQFLSFGEEKEKREKEERTISKKKKSKKEIEKEKEEKAKLQEEKEIREQANKSNIYAREFENEWDWYDRRIESLKNVDSFN